MVHVNNPFESFRTDVIESVIVMMLYVGMFRQQFIDSDARSIPKRQYYG